ncbi:DUF4383 domain-containing protein [Polymorphospora sp. NPDC051019]|uniref:DUF4383 domain-containing protein n=1 Tax=Polymorphospora sp. NPDC051019 TaxID=3155725 RepID=UPI003423295D
MAHIPVNHPLRPLYRTIAGLVGAYVLFFGIVGVVRTWGDPLFERGPVWVLGLRTNLAFAIMSVVFGLVILIGSVLGRNFSHYLNLGIGILFMAAAIGMMAVMQTDLNFLNFSMSTVIVSMIFGLIFLATGLYDKVGSPEDAHAEEMYRRQPSSRS